MDTYRSSRVPAALVALLAVGVGPSAAALTPGSDPAIEIPAGPGAVRSWDPSASPVRQLAALTAGESPPGTIIPVADLMEGNAAGEPGAPLGPGHVYPWFTIDVEGDGSDEILQIRTSPKFRLTLIDGPTGGERWNTLLRTDNIYLTSIPAADRPGQDILFLSWSPGDGRFHVAVIDAATGQQRWDKVAPDGAGLGWFGIARHGDELDVVTGVWADGGSPLTVEFRSLATGAMNGTVELLGTFNAPTIALAGDLDGDRNDDLYALEPHIAVPTMANTATLRALGDRGSETLWRTQTLRTPAEWNYLLGTVDATEDGVPDPVLLSTWFGEPAFVPVSAPEDTVVIVEGMGGPEAGLTPVVQERLDQIVYTVTAPGDIDGDGGQDLVFSGPKPTTEFSTDQRLLFEAVGPAGELWSREFQVTARWYDFIAWWWPDVGDLDGDGVHDAIVIVGTDEEGWLLEVGLNQRDGESVWERSDLSEGLTLPAGGDLSGDGTADVLDRWRISRSDFQTSIEFMAAGGRDLAGLWSRRLVLDLETTIGTSWMSGRFGGAGEGRDLFVSHNTLMEPYRHVAECLDGADGQPLWTDPKQS